MGIGSTERPDSECPRCGHDSMVAWEAMEKICAAGTEVNARVAELEEALRDCIPFLAVNMDRYRRDFGLAELHPTHAEIIDRVSRLTGGEPLSKKLSA